VKVEGHCSAIWSPSLRDIFLPVAILLATCCSPCGHKNMIVLNLLNTLQTENELRNKDVVKILKYMAIVSYYNVRHF
jgi:hypothetical protein